MFFHKIIHRKLCKCDKLLPSFLREAGHNSIKNEFSRSRLYPFDIEQVDFSKCVKDTQIRNTECAECYKNIIVKTIDCGPSKNKA